MIIGLTGTIGAGKGTIAEFLKQRGYVYYSCSDYLREELRKQGREITIPNLANLGNAIREQFGHGEIAKRLLTKISEENAIVDSLRHPDEIRALKESNKFVLIGIDANIGIRYTRLQERNREEDKLPFQEFVREEEKQKTDSGPTMQLHKCLEMADYKIDNNGTLEDLRKKLEELFKNISGKEDKFLGRKDYISWDEYFMGVALLSAERSKDPSTQVGACIVDEDKNIVGTGYNGAPRGIDDNDFPWAREGDFMETKYAYVCHAELNAILNSTKESLKNCTIYVALAPCNECAKAIIQSGIKKVVYSSDKYSDVPAFIAGRKLLEMAGIILVKLNTTISEINLKFNQ